MTVRNRHHAAAKQRHNCWEASGARVPVQGCRRSCRRAPCHGCAGAARNEPPGRKQVLQALGAIVFCVAAIAISAAICTASTATSAIDIRLTNPADDSALPLLEIRGSGANGDDPSGSYKATLNLNTVPCSGQYRLLSEQENQINGNWNSLAATATLDNVTSDPPGFACGDALPPLSGSETIVLRSGGSQPLWMRGHRVGTGAFAGKLRLSGLPQCATPYTLIARFKLGGERLTLRSHVTLSDVDATGEQGPAKVAGC
jgi:hypothetical protein